MAGFMPKIEPAVTKLAYLVPNGDSYIDLAKDLSKVNRRLYRQGMTYVVQDIQIGVGVGMAATDVVQFTFGTSGNSWIVHNAWKKAYSTWRAQVKSITSSPDGGSGDHGRHYHGAGLKHIEGKFSDFKIYLDDSMEDGTTLEPYAGDGAVYMAGEWEYSKLVFDDDGTERELKMHLIGSTDLTDTNNESGIGLIQEYADSRATIPGIGSPDVEAEASDTIYAKLSGTDEMSDMLVDNIEGDNDMPPYDQDDYPGGALNADASVPQRVGSVNATMSTTTLPGFIAPCGLIKLTTNEIQLDGSSPPVYESVSAPTTLVILTVASGPYRGVLAAPMGQ